jgi:hypothetical protein
LIENRKLFWKGRSKGEEGGGRKACFGDNPVPETLSSNFRGFLSIIQWDSEPFHPMGAL